MLRNPKRRNIFKTSLITIAFTAVYVIFGYLTKERGTASFWLVYAGCLAIGASLLYVNCRISHINAAYFCIRGFLLGEMLTSLQWQLNNFILTRFDEISGFHPVMVAIPVSLLVLILSWPLESFIDPEKTEIRLSWKHLLMISLVFIITLSLSNISYLSLNSPFSMESSYDLFTLRTAVYFGGVGISYVYHSQILETERRICAEKLYAIAQMQYNNYIVNEASIALINQKYHDLKHQLHWLRQEADSDEKLQALDMMEKEIHTYEAKVDTGNKVLDAILTTAYRTALEQGISFQCSADGKAVDFLSAVDLAALFGNAVDNAMEAVMKIDDPVNRTVDIEVQRQNNFARIRICNTYNGTLNRQNGQLRTTKPDDRFHGFGIKSIRSIVEKYCGSVTVNPDNGIYSLCILLPTENNPSYQSKRKG